MGGPTRDHYLNHRAKVVTVARENTEHHKNSQKEQTIVKRPGFTVLSHIPVDVVFEFIISVSLEANVLPRIEPDAVGPNSKTLYMYNTALSPTTLQCRYGVDRTRANRPLTFKVTLGQRSPR